MAASAYQIISPPHIKSPGTGPAVAVRPDTATVCRMFLGGACVHRGPSILMLRGAQSCARHEARAVRP